MAREPPSDIDGKRCRPKANYEPIDFCFSIEHLSLLRIQDSDLGHQSSGGPLRATSRPGDCPCSPYEWCGCRLAGCSPVEMVTVIVSVALQSKYWWPPGEDIRTLTISAKSSASCGRSAQSSVSRLTRMPESYRSETILTVISLPSTALQNSESLEDTGLAWTARRKSARSRMPAASPQIRTVGAPPQLSK